VKVAAVLEYQKLRQIGIGQGMNSTVWLARDPQLAGEIIVKEVPRSKFGNSIATYFAEAQAMFAATHQNVVPVFYAGTTVTDICIAMPYYQRGSLTDQIAASPLAVSEIIRVGQGVLAGLAHIHAAGYIHFDIKPSNVLISTTGTALVADFGQSRAISSGGAVTVPQLYRTCVPPEAFSGAVTLLADVYQAGLLLWRAMNGESEWERQIPADPNDLPSKIVTGRFPNRQRFLPHIPARLRRVIRKSLSVDPRARYQSATEFADALGQVQLRLDWRCSTSASGDMTWRATRSMCPDLVVELLHQGGAWEVRVATESAGRRRARAKGTAWRSNLSHDQAFQHLRKVFKTLS
jgi:serine/threonine protein kinase